MADTDFFTKEQTADFAKELVRQVTGKTPGSVKYIGGGSFGMVYLCSVCEKPFRLIVKAYRTDGMHEKEAFDLAALKEVCPLPVPTVYHVHEKNEEIPVNMLIMEYMDGCDAFTNPALLFKSKKKRENFACELVDSMLAIHEVKSEKFGDIRNPQFESWMDFYKPFAAGIYAKAEKLYGSGKLPGYVMRSMKNAWEQFDEIFSQTVKEAVLIHGDLNVMNVMVNAESFAITAIIDPLDMMYADREYDLFQLNNLTGKRYGLYKMYQSRYPLSRNCDVKCAFYALWNEVNCFIRTGNTAAVLLFGCVHEMNKQLKRFGALH